MDKSNKTRQPVVAVMGHVDHGKTSLLDAIRGSRVAAKEEGGITQNTRAHEVKLENGFKITFIDTPGHEAFSKMRERGAKVTDFVLLVVAADDGVQPQTKESIKFAQEQGVQIIVAINKIDIEGVNSQKVKQELSSFGVQIEEYGGDTMCFEVSATKGNGLGNLLEGIQLLSEVNELKENPVTQETVGEAFVMESYLDKKLGKSALCILKAGKLDKKYSGVTAQNLFNSRAYLNEDLKPMNVVEESQPFVLIGLDEVIDTGEIVYFVETANAKDFQAKLQSGEIEEVNKQQDPILATDLFAQMLMKREEKKMGLAQDVLNVIVKASTKGTLEAVINELNKLETEDSKVNILYSSTGEITEEDIFRAKTARAVVVSFQLPLSNAASQMAKTEKVLVRNYEIIYQMTDELSDVLDSLGQPIEEEIEIATAKVKQIFTLSDGTIVAGCEVVDGKMLKGYRVKIEKPLTKDTVDEKGRGKITSLRQGKNEVKEVKKGVECGIIIDPKIDTIAEGDNIVAFRVEKY